MVLIMNRVALSAAMILKVANALRSRGVRRENAFRNIGKQKFKLVRKMRKGFPQTREYINGLLPTSSILLLLLLVGSSPSDQLELVEEMIVYRLSKD